MSRRDDLTRRFVNIVMPDVGEAMYLVRHWHEAGTAAHGMSGPEPLPWSEIKAWRDENDISLEPFEINLIRRMSQEYCSEYHQNDPEREAPLFIDEDDFDRVAQGEAMKAKTKALRQKQMQEAAEKYTTE